MDDETRLLMEMMGKGSGFQFDAPSRWRDVECLGNCDDGVRKLAEALGWSSDLDALITAGTAAFKASQPVTGPNICKTAPGFFKSALATTAAAEPTADSLADAMAQATIADGGTPTTTAAATATATASGNGAGGALRGKEHVSGFWQGTLTSGGVSQPLACNLTFCKTTSLTAFGCGYAVTDDGVKYSAMFGKCDAETGAVTLTIQHADAPGPEDVYVDGTLQVDAQGEFVLHGTWKSVVSQSQPITANHTIYYTSAAETEGHPLVTAAPPPLP